MNKNLRREIIDFLTESFSLNDLKAAVNDAFWGHRLAGLIEDKNSNHGYASGVIDKTLKYGQSETIQYLEALKSYTGTGNQQKLQQFIDEITSSPSSTYKQSKNDLSRVNDVNKVDIPQRQHRRLEAAMPSQTRLGSPTELWVQISLPDSPGLDTKLPAIIKKVDVIEKSDRVETDFYLEFQTDENGITLDAEICIKVTSDYFLASHSLSGTGSCKNSTVPLQIEIDKDTPHIIFSLQPHNQAKTGRAFVKIEVYQNDKWICETGLNTELVTSIEHSVSWIIKYQNILSTADKLIDGQIRSSSSEGKQKRQGTRNGFISRLLVGFSGLSMLIFATGILLRPNSFVFSNISTNFDTALGTLLPTSVDIAMLNTETPTRRALPPTQTHTPTFYPTVLGTIPPSANLYIFIDENSLILYVPTDEQVLLERLIFEVSNDTYPFDTYNTFAGIPLSPVIGPICFRVRRSGTSRALPNDCPRQMTFTQELANADIFWYSEDDGYPIITIKQGERLVGLCQGGDAECRIYAR